MMGPAAPQPEQQQHGQQPEQQPEPAARHYLAYGDSLTAGYHSDGQGFSPYSLALAAALPGECSVDSCGASGAKVHALAAELELASGWDVADQEYSGLGYLLQRRLGGSTSAALEAPQYTAALIMGGTNDLAVQWEAAEIMASLRTLHECCYSFGLRTVALCVPPNRVTAATSDDPGLLAYQSNYHTLNRLIAEFAAASDGRTISVDTAKLVPWGADGCWEPDGLHFSPKGSEMLGKRLAALPAVREFLLGSSSSGGGGAAKQ
eukprot:COSAG05_NODE_2124_length_3525_cov_2.233800_2_plen_263_part_00